MSYYEFTLASEQAMIEAMLEKVDYTIIGFTTEGLVCLLAEGWVTK